MKKDNIINSKEKEETSNKIESYLDDIMDVVLVKSDKLKVKIEDSISNIKRLKDDLYNFEASQDINYNFFSPIYQSDSITMEKVASQISLLDLQLNEYREDYENNCIQINHITQVKDYIKNLETLNNKAHNHNYNDLEQTDYNIDVIKAVFICDEMGLKLLKTQELERKRIARDLHDSTVQNLTSLIHKTELCSKYVDIDNIRTKLELETMKKTIRTTINDMREIIYDLRPMSLDDLGFITTVKRYLDQLMKNSGIIITFNIENEKNDIYPIVTSTLFRVIQEACNNVIKHAMANNINIDLIFHDFDIVLKIEDDGIGFDTAKYLKRTNKMNSNFGLSIMKERVYLLSGQIQIDSKKKHGTKIFIKVPMSSCMEEKE